MSFTKEDTKMMKGIAILLMLAHHLFLFPQRMPIGYELVSMFTLAGMGVEEIIGSFGKICVSLFMFLGGYGLYCKSTPMEGGHRKIAIGGQLHVLYTSLWKVMAIFIPIGFLFFGNQEAYSTADAQCFFYSDFNLKELVANLTGWNMSYNGEWWFFTSYIYALFWGCVFLEIIGDRQAKHRDICLLLVLDVILTRVLPVIPRIEILTGLRYGTLYTRIFNQNAYIPIFFMGIVMAKYDGIEEIRRIYRRYAPAARVLICLFILALVALLRIFLDDSGEIDLFLVPVFIAAAGLLLELAAPVRRVLLFFGKHSTNMWLTHSFFCFYFGAFAKAVYFSRNAIVAYAELLALSVGASILLEWFWSTFFSVLKRCFPAKA